MHCKWKVLIALTCGLFAGSIVVSDGRSYCRDGSTTRSSGRGACSWHGGQGMQPAKRVVFWVYVASVGVWAYFSFIRSGPEGSSSGNQRPKGVDTPRPTHPCPTCGSQMRLRTARKGRFKGSKFWGCSRYPLCTSIVSEDKATSVFGDNAKTNLPSPNTSTERTPE